MTKLVALNKETNTAVVSRGGAFVFIDINKKDVIKVEQDFTLNESEGWIAGQDEVPKIWGELVEAATTTFAIEDTAHAENDRVFRVPVNVQKASKFFATQTTTLKDIHEFSNSSAYKRRTAPTLVKDWVAKITDQFPLPTSLIASGFAAEPTSVYYGRVTDPDTTNCDAMYAQNVEGQWAERIDGQWTPIEENPEETYNLILLDPESAASLADWADEPDELDGSSFELSSLNPHESGMFYAAEAELDFEFLDRLFDVYDSTERSINAKKQVRAPGGKFGPNPGGGEGTAAAPKARLPQSLPLIPDINARIVEYLAQVAQERGEEPPEPGAAGVPIPEPVNPPPSPTDPEGKRKENTFSTREEVETKIEELRVELANETISAADKLESLLSSDVDDRVRLKAATEILDRVGIEGTEFAVTAQQAGVPETDAKPLYVAIVDDLDTDAVLDLVSLVPPAAGTKGDVSAWKRAAGQWVAASDLLAALRGSTPPSCVEITDPAMLKAVIEQVDKSTAEEGEAVKAPGETEVAPDGTAPASQPVTPQTAPIPVKTSNFGAQADGSYPINNKADLKKAIQAYGRSKNKPKTKRHIISEAKKLGATSLLPESWNFSNFYKDMAARGYAFSDQTLLVLDAEDLKAAVASCQTPEQQFHVIKRARALNRVDLLPDHWDLLETPRDYSLWGPHGELLSISAAGGADQYRGNASRLKRYWTVGLGGTKIRWRSPGDWTRCVAHLSKYLGVRARGYCNLRHFEMNGYYPGDKKNR